MKRVVFSAEVETVKVEKINDALHVGIILNDNSKAQIVKAKDGFFANVPFNPDMSDVWFAPSKYTYLTYFNPEPKAFVFETKDDLIAWLKS